MTRAQVLNAFSPAQEVADPALFAGRRDQVRELSDALRSHGYCPIIYGHRGLGKTSLALQAQLLAIGSTGVLTEDSDSQWLLADDETFLSVLVTCSDEIDNFDQLQQKMINTLRGFATETVATAKEQIVDRQTKRKISLKYYERETTRKYEIEASRVVEEDLSLTEKIHAEVRLLNDYFNARVLIIVDELDRVKDLSGLASFIKSSSSTDFKIMLVGIADSLAELDLDHPSIERNTWAIRVPLMPKRELSEIVDRATRKLAEDGSNIEFSNDARQRLADIAGGFPWFVHVIGHESLRLALDLNLATVDVEHVDNAVSALSASRFSQRYTDQYRSIVRDSVNREIVLRLMAKWRNSDVPISAIYWMARRAGVSNPAVYRGHLQRATYGAHIVSPIEAERHTVRFCNEMFKHYIRLRTTIHMGLQQQIDAAYNDYFESHRTDE